MLVEDATAFLKDFGQTVAFGSQSTLAILDQPDSQVLSGHVQTTQYRLTYPTAALTGLVHGSVVTLGAKTFRILGTPNMLDDGLFSEAHMERVS